MSGWQEGAILFGRANNHTVGEVALFHVVLPNVSARKCVLLVVMKDGVKSVVGKDPNLEGPETNVTPGR